MWTVILRKDTTLRLSVMSGTVVIGFVKLPVEALLGQLPDLNGLSEFEGYLMNGKDTISRGMIRFTYAAEPFVDVEDEAVDSDDEIFDYNSISTIR
jgi:hypothetical protein